MNPIHEANRRRWNLAAPNWKAMHDQRGAWRNCPTDPTLAFYENELPFLQNMEGKKVAVLGSGDNLCAFALAGMGASVCSVDISENQLDIAKERAEDLDLSIQFLRADVTDLHALDDEQFDLVYTGGHVAVWVGNLKKYYSEAVRILKTGGQFIINEYHPMRRLWKEDTDQLVLAYDYYNRGPYEFSYGDDILSREMGNIPSYEHHWTISDFIQAILEAGCQIKHVDEMGTHVGDWEGPVSGMPECILIVSTKS